MSNSTDPADKLIFALQNDLKTLALSSKKHGIVKDSCEDAISRIRNARNTTNPMGYITNAALLPVIQGCETKDPKIVKLCLHSIQRLITAGHVDAKAAKSACDTIVMLLDNNLEEIKILQTITLLLTTNNVVTGDLLAKNLVLCFRLHFSKDNIISAAAGATVRQLVALVFERIDKDKPVTGRDLPVEAEDAYSLFQDLILLVNGEQPCWLVGLTEMTRCFGLELLETILARFPFVFEKYEQFGLILKERVCAMVIKLFSPNAKFKATLQQQHSQLTPDISLDKPFYPISVRLLRIVDILINKYYTLLVTECEIFLSLLVRFLDPDKPTWQRCLALEVLHKLITSPSHLSKFCRSYDLKPHATNICKDMVNALGAYVQSVFANPIGAMSSILTSSSSSHTGSSNSSNNSNSHQSNMNNMNGPSSSSLHGHDSSSNSSSPMGFYFRGSLVPLVHIYAPSTPKPQLMELTDKQEPPLFATCESYGVAISFACLSDFVLSLVAIDRGIHEKGKTEDVEILKQLLSSSWPGLLAALNLLLEASIDDNITESICERLVDMATLSGKVPLQQCREATVLSLCVATLPPHYGYAVLKGTIGHGESPHPVSYSEMDNGKQQVVVVGTSVVPSLALPSTLQSTPVMLTRKNLLVTHSVLRLCLESGAILLTSWLTVLTTLQHLCWVCGVAKSSTDFISNTPIARSTLDNNNKGINQNQINNSQQDLSVNSSANLNHAHSFSSSSSSSSSGSNTNNSNISNSSEVGELSVNSSGKSSIMIQKGGGLVKGANGSVSVVGGSNNGGVMGVVVDFVSCLSQGVMRLIETSVTLDDVSLHHVINALTNLSQEAMEIAYSNREPSLFAVAKLLEIGLVNLDRVEIYWRPLTNHLLEVCRHPHMRMREWGSEAITFLVRCALLHSSSNTNSINNTTSTTATTTTTTTNTTTNTTTTDSSSENNMNNLNNYNNNNNNTNTNNNSSEKLSALLLSPLCELSTILHNDVRKKQLVALNQILHCKGEKLKSSWPLAINILGDIYEHHSESLIRSAFQCLQLVVTDYLPVLPCGCLPQSIDTVAKFARQKQELNVALSAIGLTWNIADFLYQNREKILQNLTPDIAVFPDFPGVVTEIPQFDRLWLGIYQRLGELCADERPAVRKSSGQTLFSTIAAHSNILSKGSWDSVMWQVLFCLLEAVETSWKNASCEKVDGQKNALLIHHSRNTEQKQWAETHVLVLSGIAKIFSIKRNNLLQIQDYPKAWFFFLQFMQNGATSTNEEVSLAALKSFQESLVFTSDNLPTQQQQQQQQLQQQQQQQQNKENVIIEVPEETWSRSWLVYCDIGQKVICERGAHQQYLAAYVTIFQYLYPHLKHKLTVEDIQKLNGVFAKALVIPLTAEGASSILFSSSDNGITPLQDQIYHAYDIILEDAKTTPTLKNLLLPIVLQLINFGAAAVQTNVSAKAGIQLEGVVPSCQEFGVKCLRRAVACLSELSEDKFVQESYLFSKTMQSFRPILGSRFQNSEGPWRECSEQFFTAVPYMVKYQPKDVEFWGELARCAQEFLFFSENGNSGEWVTKKGWKDEKMDSRMVTLLKTLVFQNDGFLPSQFLIEVVKIFHRGSCINEYDGINVSEREEFVRACFSSLLEFVLKGPSSVSEIVAIQSGDDGKKIAVLALLQRFQNILLNYRDYVNHNSHIPIQRHRLAEMNFVLRAIASLIDNLKTADPARVAPGTWTQIIAIYPDLVGIVGLPGVDTSISLALRDALLSYKDLLARPSDIKKKSTGTGTKIRK